MEFLGTTIGVDTIAMLLGGGAVAALIELFRYRRLDKANATTIEKTNVELANKNNAIALETDNKILLTMQSRMELLVKEIDKYSVELKAARKEIRELSFRIEELEHDNKRLIHALKSFNDNETP